MHEPFFGTSSIVRCELVTYTSMATGGVAVMRVSCRVQRVGFGGGKGKHRWRQRRVRKRGKKGGGNISAEELRRIAGANLGITACRGREEK